MAQKREYELAYGGKVPADAVTEATAPCRLAEVKRFGSGSFSNMLISGDNLSALKALMGMKDRGRLKNGDGSPGARLVYIDPPFSTGLDFKDRSRRRKAYGDKMLGAEFVEFLRRRLILLRGVLADDGSIFVHLDWKKAHYAKVIMDEVFGEENFLNDIIWSYGGRGAKAVSGQFSRNHDIILWYCKGASHIFNQTCTQRRVRKGTGGFRQDQDGRWFKTSPRGDYTDLSVEALSRENRVYRTKNGNIRIKYFVREDGDHLIEDRLVGDVWDDIPDAMHLPSGEKTGYPTQKPEALLARIIRTASGPGDLVLDAFAGAGTALVAAEKLGRRWIGIDSGRLAIQTIEKRFLGINRSRDLENPGKDYRGRLRRFSVYETAPSCLHGLEPRVSSAYSLDEKTGECVIRISRFSSPEAPGLANLEALSHVMLDLGFNGKVFRLHAARTAEELRDSGYEMRFPAGKVRGKVMVVYCDIFGNEKWFLGELA